MRAGADMALVLPDHSLHRLVPSHFPSIDLFEGFYDSPEEMAIVFELEAMTNPRLRADVGRIEDLSADEWVYGAGATPLMAAFTHYGRPTRFTDGSFGVYYAADTLKTALAEVSHHTARFYAATNEPDAEITVREYVNRAARPLLDIRGDARYHAPDDYAVPQAFAARERGRGTQGLVYDSVRRPGGICVAAFLPKALTIPRQGKHLRLVWSGKQQSIVHHFAISHVR